MIQPDWSFSYLSKKNAFPLTPFVFPFPPQSFCLPLPFLFFLGVSPSALLFTGQQAWLAQPLSLLLHTCYSRHQALSFLAARPIWLGFMVREGGPPHTPKESPNSSLTAQKLFWISSNRCLHPIAFPTHYLIHWPSNQEAASGSLRALHLAIRATQNAWNRVPKWGSTGLQTHMGLLRHG